MDGAVTVQTGPAVKPVTWVAASEGVFGIIGSAGMARPVMTILTEVRNTFNQQLAMDAAVRGMTVGTIFRNRRVFENKGATFVWMAFVTELIDVFRPDHRRRHCAVDVMAVTAFDLALNYGMVRLFPHGRSDIFMTIEADSRLLYDHLSFMNSVAGNARYVIAVVLAHIPHGQLRTAVMAAETLFAEFIRGPAARFCKSDY